jgi:hypothetical protein
VVRTKEVVEPVERRPREGFGSLVVVGPVREYREVVGAGPAEGVVVAVGSPVPTVCVLGCLSCGLVVAAGGVVAGDGDRAGQYTRMVVAVGLRQLLQGGRAECQGIVGVAGPPLYYRESCGGV